MVSRRSEKVIGRRREQIRIYVTAEQSELVRMRAHNEGVSISRVVVDTVFGSEGVDAAALPENFGAVVEAVDQVTDEVNDLLLKVRIN